MRRTGARSRCGRSWWLPFVYRFLAWLADRHGALPGRRIGFGGQEARGTDPRLGRSGLSGRYAAAGLDIDLEAALAAVRPMRTRSRSRSDWLGPESSLRFLLSKLPRSREPRSTCSMPAALGTRADHYAWMKAPDAVAARFNR